MVTLRVKISNLLERANTEMKLLGEDGDYATALRKKGEVDILEKIYMILNKSKIMDVEIE